MLDHANAGVAMTAGLEESLVDYRATQARIAQGRVDSIKRQRALILRYESDSGFDVRIREAAGKTAESKLFSELRSLSDSRADDASKLDSALSALDASMAKLVSPLPDNTAQLKETQKTMAEMGAELSARKRVAEALAFAKTVKTTVEDNKKKADTPASGPAPMQADPTPNPNT